MKNIVHAAVVAILSCGPAANAVETVKKTVAEMDSDSDGYLSFQELRLAGANPVIALASDLNGDRRLSWWERKSYRTITRNILAIQTNNNLTLENRTKAVVEFGLVSDTSSLWNGLEGRSESSLREMREHFRDLAQENGLLPKRRARSVMVASDDNDDDRIKRIQVVQAPEDTGGYDEVDEQGPTDTVADIAPVDELDEGTDGDASNDDGPTTVADIVDNDDTGEEELPVPVN